MFLLVNGSYLNVSNIENFYITDDLTVCACTVGQDGKIIMIKQFDNEDDAKAYLGNLIYRLGGFVDADDIEGM